MAVGSVERDGVEGVMVFVGFRGPDIVPERAPDYTPTGRPTMRKRTKTERNDLYAEAIAAFTVANARKAIAAVPKAEFAVVVTLRPLDDRDALEAVSWVRCPREELMRNLGDRDALSVLYELGGSLDQRGRTAQVVEVSFEGEEQLRSLVLPFRRGERGIHDAEAFFREDLHVRMEIKE